MAQQVQDATVAHSKCITQFRLCAWFLQCAQDKLPSLLCGAAATGFIAWGRHSAEKDGYICPWSTSSRAAVWARSRPAVGSCQLSGRARRRRELAEIPTASQAHRAAPEVPLGATSTGPRILVSTLKWRAISAMSCYKISFIGVFAMAHAPQDFMGWSSPLATKREPKPLFRSEKSKVSVSESTDVTVDLKLDAKHLHLEALLPRLQSILDRQAGSPMEASALHRLVRSVMKEVIETSLQRELTGEFEEIVAAYRDMLERRVASGHDESISRALTRAKLQSETLASVPMVEQGEACALLGLSDTNPSATLKRYETRNRILRFDWKGKAAYPLFQFDVAERRIHPTLIKLMDMRTDEWGGKMALLHWLTRPNRSLGGARPCDRLAEDADAIVESFLAEIAEPLNG